MRKHGRYDIVVPTIPYAEDTFIRVSKSSPDSHKRALRKLSLFSTNECNPMSEKIHFDTVSHPKDVGYMWVGSSWDYDTFPIIGGVHFADQPSYDNQIWLLIWAWIHPYNRRQGLLSKAWPQLKEEFKCRIKGELQDFYCDQPLSDSMVAFLKKHKHPPYDKG